MKTWKKSRNFVGLTLAILAVVGLSASFALGYETVQVMKDPTYSPACNLSPIIGCSKTMASPQAEIFGIPNPVFGLMGFTALLTFAVIFLMGSKMPARLWQMVTAVAFAGMLFMLYLFVTSLTVLGSICPWCSLLWITTIAIFWVASTYAADNGAFDEWKAGKHAGRWWSTYSSPVIVALYVSMLAAVFIRFSDYWLSVV